MKNSYVNVSSYHPGGLQMFLVPSQVEFKFYESWIPCCPGILERCWYTVGTCGLNICGGSLPCFNSVSPLISIIKDAYGKKAHLEFCFLLPKFIISMSVETYS